MSFGLLTEDEARNAMWERVNSNDWWIIPWVSEAASQFSQVMEERAYSGDAGIDFDLFTCNPPDCGVFVVAFAHKRRIGREALARLMLDNGATPPGIDEETLVGNLAEQDVLVMVDTTDEQSAALSAARVYLWHAWMKAGKC